MTHTHTTGAKRLLPTLLAALLFPCGMFASSPFQPTVESLAAYECPEWFRDAKFGIWSHWGPQAVPGDGDWYARRMYLVRPSNGYGIPDYQLDKKPDRGYIFHLGKYGHPSKFGFKDIIPLWRAERWNPERLMDLYVKAGARYFVSMAVHHDNFDLWDSTHQPRWNSVKTGPRRDVVGEWQRAAKKHGLPFGVSEHLGASFTWLQAAKGADVDGPLKGVPYDGADPQYHDLYHPPTKPGDTGWYTNNPEFHRHWSLRINDLVAKYKPDMLYTDGGIPFQKFGDTGLKLIADYYNDNLDKNDRPTVVYTCKQTPALTGWVRDLEQGVLTGIEPQPWQTDTSIGDWYYREGDKYKSTTQIIQMLCDIISKNGSLLLNIIQHSDGEIEPRVEQTLIEIAAWMRINSGAIYGTRPWRVYGEGPGFSQPIEKGRWGGAKDVRAKPYEPGDMRFTQTKDGTTLYAYLFAWPADGKITITSLAGDPAPREVSLIGHDGKLSWRQTPAGIAVALPSAAPCEHVSILKISWYEPAR